MSAATLAGHASADGVVQAAITFAEDMYASDIAANQALGTHGRHALWHAAKERKRGTSDGKLRVLTHCNTGSLATAQYGTALGCMRALHQAGELAHAYCTETRCAIAPRHHLCIQALSMRQLLFQLNTIKICKRNRCKHHVLWIVPLELHHEDSSAVMTCLRYICSSKVA